MINPGRMVDSLRTIRNMMLNPEAKSIPAIFKNNASGMIFRISVDKQFLPKDYTNIIKINK